ncbi:MAG: rhomboid family intramembrane serine protease [Bacteroidales bacterium]|nr:rhomboid family intramembrane serine protease [Bacteroidales bacterium]
MAQLDRLFGNIPAATRNLFLVNALMFIATCINQNFMVATFAMFFPTSPFFHWWQPVTHMFMHGGFWHIFLNMWCLLMFGSALERAIGTKKFVLFYFVAGLGAVAVHTLVQYLQGPMLNVPTLGASGAIYGIQIGYAMLYPNDIWTLVFPPVSMKAKWFVLIFIAIELFTGITGTADGVAHFAHLGGALFGFLLMLYWKKTGKVYRNW